MNAPTIETIPLLEAPEIVDLTAWLIISPPVIETIDLLDEPALQ